MNADKGFFLHGWIVTINKKIFNEMEKIFYSFYLKFCYSGTRRIFAWKYQKEVIHEDEKSRNNVNAALSVDRLYCKT